jgi:SAM-dependent methyltransferase
MNAVLPKTDFPITIFDLYPQAFATTTTLFQSEELRAVGELVSGDVVDLGCGSAKLAPYLQGNPALKSYMGVDPSAAMLVEARHLLVNLDDPRFSLMHRRMEDCDLTGYDWAVCLNALYAVENPEFALQNIRRMLKPGGHLIITTPNQNLDMEKLLDECRKDLILHPLFHTFRDINRVLAQQYRANFVTMDKLMLIVESADFEVQQLHSRFFAGGLNFLVARNPA